MGMKNFNLPDPGEGLVEADIVSWKVKEGDEVKVNTIVVEIETAKSLVELPIPWAGTVAKILVPEGQTVEVGTPIVVIDVPGAEDDPAAALKSGDSEEPSSGRSGLIPASGTSESPEGEGAGSSGEAGSAAGEGSSQGQGTRDYTLPDPGEGLVEADIVSWKVKEGDEVKVNTIVVEIETAKSLVELPIPWAGTVAKILVEEGTTVSVGTPIITIASPEFGEAPAAKPAPQAGAEDAEDAEEKPEGAPKREPNLVGYGAMPGSTKRRARKGAPAAAAEAPAPQAEPAPQAQPQTPLSVNERPRTKPPVRKFAKDHGVDLHQVMGSGPEGIITRQDVERFLEAGTTSAPVDSAETAPAPSSSSYTPPTFAQGGDRETRTPIKGVRKVTAQAMVQSMFTAPHVTEFLTVDATGLMEFTDALKKDRAFKDVKISPMVVFSRMVLIALKRNPGMIAKWDEAAQEIVQPHYVNLGFAAATPRGLMVPNIKDADQMDMHQLAEAFGHYIDVARSGKLQPADYAGGSITITNVGVFGVDTGTPVINPGESSIVAFGQVRRMPWVVERDGVEEIVPRWVTQLAVAFDHRLIDGELGSKFLADLGALVTDPGKALLWA